jgi:prolyl-tRNA synthetase
MFLRTAEFLWQEGHTAHATSEEAQEETSRMLEVYATFAEQWMALPVIRGAKTPNERFAGAEDTLCIEGLMQDGKALQCGTSHFLGQNFARAFDVTFTNKTGERELVWGTSWGVSTRLMGALIMAHSDDNGLVLPPKLAPIQVVIVPIYRAPEDLQKISEKVSPLVAELKAKGISVKFDDSDNNKPGWKFAEYELRGVPVRVAMGMRDLENGTLEIARRDTLTKETQQFEGAADFIANLLDEIQMNIYQKALSFHEENTHAVNSWDEFKEQIERGGFISAHWDGTAETEEKIKEETKATIRCIPMNAPDETGNDVYSGKPSNRRVLFARAY